MTSVRIDMAQRVSERLEGRDGRERLDGLAADSDNDVSLELHQLARQTGQAVDLVVGESPLDDEVSALDVADLA